MKISFVFLYVLTTNTSFVQKDFYTRLSDAAIALTKQKVTYDGSYFRINYPNGDVPADKGVCTDVVIRAYRTLGIDLQRKYMKTSKEISTNIPTNGVSQSLTKI